MNRDEFALKVLIADANEMLQAAEREDGCGWAFLPQPEAGFHARVRWMQ
jgi:hypothetical protein